MGSRQYRNDSKTAAEGIIFIDFSFMTNGTGAVVNAYTADGTAFRGLGVKSVTLGATGTFAVVLSDNFRWVISKYSDMDDMAGDGAYATIGVITNEGTTLPIGCTIKTWTAGGVATNFGTGGTGVARRVSVAFTMKNSLAGV